MSVTENDPSGNSNSYHEGADVLNIFDVFPSVIYAKIY